MSNCVSFKPADDSSQEKISFLKCASWFLNSPDVHINDDTVMNVLYLNIINENTELLLQIRPLLLQSLNIDLPSFWKFFVDDASLYKHYNHKYAKKLEVIFGFFLGLILKEHNLILRLMCHMPESVLLYIAKKVELLAGNDDAIILEMLSQENFNLLQDFKVFQYFVDLFQMIEMLQISDKFWQEVAGTRFLGNLIQCIVKVFPHASNEDMSVYLQTMFDAIYMIVSSTTVNSNYTKFIDVNCDRELTAMAGLLELRNYMETGPNTCRNAEKVFDIVKRGIMFPDATIVNLTAVNLLTVEQQSHHKKSLINERLPEPALTFLCYFVGKNSFDSNKYAPWDVKSMTLALIDFRQKQNLYFGDYENSLVHITKSLPKISLRRTTAQQSSHRSTHEPVSNVIPVEVGMIVEEHQLLTQNSSSYLSYINQGYSKNEHCIIVPYGSESCIQSQVGLLIFDVLQMLGLNKWFMIHSEATVKGNLLDLFILKSLNGRPLAAIEIKSFSDGDMSLAIADAENVNVHTSQSSNENASSSSANILEDLQVLGQGLDYLTCLRLFSGQVYSFVIATNGYQCRVLCEKHAKEYLESTSKVKFEDSKLTMHVDVSTRSSVDLSVASTNAQENIENKASKSTREVCASKIINGNDPEFILTIASVILKAVHSPINNVQLFDTTRAYIKYSQDVWHWDSSPEYVKKIVNDPASLVYGIVPYHNTEHFYILQYFRKSLMSDSTVALALGGMTLCVIKLFDDIETRDREFDCWKKFNNIICLKRRLLDKKFALIMPYVLTYSRREHGYELCNEIQYWGCLEGIPILQDNVSAHFNNEIKVLLDDTENSVLTNIDNVYQSAKKTMPLKECHHGDPSPSNIGLLIVTEKVEIKDNKEKKENMENLGNKDSKVNKKKKKTKKAKKTKKNKKNVNTRTYLKPIFIDFENFYEIGETAGGVTMDEMWKSALV